MEQLLEGKPGEPGTAVLSLRDVPGPGTNILYIGDYELLEVVAYGGMGVVYQARQRGLDRIVALKLLLGGEHAKADFKKRFRQEAEMAAKLQHPNIVPIYEVGEHDGQPYFSMEYVAGTNLASAAREKPLPPRKAAEYVKTVSETVAYAHQQGVIHRDLKPSNILLGHDDRLRITDFGLARRLDADSSLTATGEVLGTPGYLPPEQASVTRGKIGPQSDVYAIGAVLYYLLTGRPPFVAGTLADTLQQVLKSEPVSLRRLNPVIPRDLETICVKCLQKEPERRYASVQALANDLGCFLNGQPIHARPASASERVLKWYKREPLVAGLATAVAFVLLAGLAISLSLWGRAEKERIKTEGLATKLAAESDAAKKARDEVKKKAQELEDAQRFMAELTRFKNELDGKSARPPTSGQVPTLAVARTESANAPNWLAGMGEGVAHLLIDEFSKLTNFMVLESIGLNDLRAEPTVDQNRDASSPTSSRKGQWKGADFTFKSVVTRFGSKPVTAGGSEKSISSAGQTNEVEVQIEWRIVDNTTREIVRGGVGRTVATRKGAFYNFDTWQGGNLTSDRGFMDSAVAKALLGSVAMIVEKVKTLNLTPGMQPLSDNSNPNELISPSAKMALSNYVERLLAEWNPNSSLESDQLNLDQNPVSQRISELIGTLGILTNKIAKWEGMIKPLADGMVKKGHHVAAEQLLNAVLAPDVISQPDCINLLRLRAALRARHRHWRGAAADLTIATQLQPTNHLNYHLLAPVIVESADDQAYERFIAKVLKLFADTDSAVIAERMTKACLIKPVPGLDLSAFDKLAQTATASTNQLFQSFYQLARALAEYRLGRFASAAEWASLSLRTGGNRPDNYRDVLSYLVLAMASRHLDQTVAAQDAYQKGIQIAAKSLPPADADDLGDSWNDWIVVHLLMQQAKELLESGAK